MDETFFYVMLMGFVPVEVAERNVNVNNERGENIADFFFFFLYTYLLVNLTLTKRRQKKKRRNKGRGDTYR